MRMHNMTRIKQKPMEIYVHQVTSASHVQSFNQIANTVTLDTRRTLYPDDDASVYSIGSSYSQAYHANIFDNSGPSTSSSPNSPNFNGNFQNSSSSQIDTTRPDSEIDPYTIHNQNLHLPQVVVWSPLTDNYSEDPNGSSYSEQNQNQGRAPSAIPTSKMNFSRPRRQPTSPESDAHKREVLQRNGYRTSPRMPPSPSSQKSDSSDHNQIEKNSPVRYFISPSSHKEAYAFDAGHDPPNFFKQSDLHVSSPPSNSRLLVDSHIPSSFFTMENNGHTHKQAVSPSLIPTNAPVARPNTPESVYSQYSYYQLDSEASSPNVEDKSSRLEDQKFSSEKESLEDQGVTKRFSRVMQAVSSSATFPAPPQAAQSAEYYLQLGIGHHEANELEESARCFEKSATENGGCAIGMLMWGLSLRHGWGCRLDEKTAFMWLRKAAEHALVVLEGAKQDRQALKTELVLAVYEVGQCFYRGWGVRQDKKMGFSYFQSAAQMGDPDAQQDLAFCLANGKGCKKDRKAAAKWYRAAVEQGASTVGLAWIYKSKYMD